MNNTKRPSFDFYTLETGHSVRSNEGQVNPMTINALSPIVRSGSGEILGIEVKFVELSHGSDAIFDIHAPGKGRIARCYLGYDAPRAMKEKIKSDHSAAAARPLGGDRFLAVSLSHGADFLTSEMMQGPEVLEVIQIAADFERCIAWTLIHGHRPSL